MQAALQQDMKVNLLAINHWERALETHAANHPSAEHLCESVERIDPTKVIRGGKLDLLWASPECTHHSVARGGRPRSDQSRASAWLILKWLQELYVKRVIIENVPEFLSWGPLDSKGQPIKNKKGELFNCFISSLRSLGYTVDWKILTCADYGDPTTRRRLFVQAVRGKKRIMWPQITHMDGAGDSLFGCQPWIPARDIIDWNLPGTSIFDRKKPLADATIRRIAAGIEKYWGDYAKPFLAVLYGTSDVRSLDLPLPSVTASGAHHALIEPVPLLMGHQSGQGARSVDQPVHTVLAQGRVNLIQPMLVDFTHKNKPSSVEQPLRTITTKCHFGLVEPLIMEYYGNGGTEPVSNPLKTVTTKDRFALLEPFMLKACHSGGERTMSIKDPVPSLTCSNENAVVQPFAFNIGQGSAKNRARSIDEPLSTVVTKAEHCLIEPGVCLDIRFRMLKNHELKRAQGFPEDYVLKGNVTEQTKQIGNAVPVNTAKALALAVMSA
ncbi:MAG: DNA cytosine methyltransferase [Treponema sp.]|nr:DNA cytosine methyltransferase [Treponema sp.]